MLNDSPITFLTGSQKNWRFFVS